MREEGVSPNEPLRGVMILQARYIARLSEEPRVTLSIENVERLLIKCDLPQYEVDARQLISELAV